MRKNIGKIKNATLKKEYRRKLSIRKKVSGTSERPRIAITKSNKNIRAQVIDDTAGVTLFSIQTFGKNGVGGSSNVEGAKKVGKAVADGFKKINKAQAVFDRSGKQYTGVVAALADSIRENGVQI